MMWRLLTWGIIAATLLFPVASGFGAERVVTRRDNFGEDLRFVDQYLGLTWPEYYRTQAPVEVGFEFSLDDVYVGRYDVNGDGQAELFVHVQYVGLCGSGGCPTYVFERKNGEWANVSRIVGDPYMDVWVDPDTGYKTVFSYYSGLRWTGERYQFIGDAQVVEVSAQMPPDFEGEGGCVEPRQDGVEYLMAYVATKKPMCLIYDPTVKSALDGLMGTEFLHLRKNLDRRPSIGYYEGNLVLEGSRRPVHGGGEERAMLMVRVFDGEVRVGILSNGVRTIYAGDNHWSDLPTLLRAWARGHLDPYDFEAPQDIVWIGRAEE